MSKKNEEVQKFEERLKGFLSLDGDDVDSYAKSLVQADGKAHIKVDICHGGELYDPYSGGHDLSSGVFSYVESAAKYVRSTLPVSIDFLISPKEVSLEGDIVRQYHSNYRFDFDENQHEIKKSTFSIVRLYIVGILLLILTSVLTGFYHALDNSGQANLANYLDIASQVSSIASWVFIWDAVDKQAFERKALRRKAFRLAQLAAADVSFVVTPENEEKA